MKDLENDGPIRILRINSTMPMLKHQYFYHVVCSLATVYFFSLLACVCSLCVLCSFAAFVVNGD